MERRNETIVASTRKRTTKQKKRKAKTRREKTDTLQPQELKDKQIRWVIKLRLRIDERPSVMLMCLFLGKPATFPF